jgi:hypothetical protein
VFSTGYVRGMAGMPREVRNGMRARRPRLVEADMDRLETGIRVWQARYRRALAAGDDVAVQVAADALCAARRAWRAGVAP